MITRTEKIYSAFRYYGNLSKRMRIMRNCNFVRLLVCILFSLFFKIQRAISERNSHEFIFQLGFVPARYILAILGSIAMAIVYGLKVNLSVAMVAMLNHTAIKLASDASHKNASILTTNLTTIAHGGNEGESCASGTTSSAAIEVIS